MNYATDQIMQNATEKWPPAQERRSDLFCLVDLGENFNLQYSSKEEQQKKTQWWKAVFYAQECILQEWKNFVVAFFSETQKTLMVN